MNKLAGPFFYKIAEGIGKAFGLDAGDWIVIILTLLLFAVVAIILYVVSVIIVVSIKDYFHNISLHSIEKSQTYRWFEQVMVKICEDSPVPITIDTPKSTIQFSPIEKINYTYVIGGDDLTISVDKNAILLKPTETEEDIKIHIAQFRNDYKSILSDSAVKDIEGYILSDYNDKYLMLFVTIPKDSINTELLPLLNKAILSFVGKISHDRISKGMKWLPNETQDDFIEKTDIALKKHGIVIPTSCRHFKFSCIKREDIIEPHYVFVNIYINKDHPLSKKKEDIELVLDELEKSQQEEYNIYEKERLHSKNIEDFNKLFGNQSSQEVVLSNNTASDNKWKWWFIGAIIILIWLLTLL